MTTTSAISPVTCPPYAYVGDNPVLHAAFIRLVTLTPLEGGQNWECGVIPANVDEGDNQRYHTAIFDGLGYHTGPDMIVADITLPQAREAALDVIDAICGQMFVFVHHEFRRHSAKFGPN